jgi:hypothetical protein
MNLVSSGNGKNGKGEMNNNKIARGSKTSAWVSGKPKGLGVFFGLLSLFLLPGLLSAQSGTGAEGYDDDGKAIVGILPFIGDGEAAEVFNRAVVTGVTNLQKYSSRSISAGAVEAAGVRIPTDMPPVRELVPGVRYALTGGVYPGTNSNEYYLQLWLWDITGSTMIYTDDLVYQDINEGLKSVPGLVEWLFSHIIEVTPEDEAPPESGWEEKLISIGVRSGLSQRWYTSPDETAPGARALNFEGGLFLSVRLSSLFSLQAEADFSFDNLVYRGVTITGREGTRIPLENVKYTTNSLAFPLLFKLNLRAGNFRIAPLAGIYGFLPLGKASYREQPLEREDAFSWSAAAPLGYILGLEAAMKFGPGMLVGDIRYAGDFSSITVHDAPATGKDTSYKRMGLSFTLGYAFGFVDIKGR